jgi:hypothetical protein
MDRTVTVPCPRGNRKWDDAPKTAAQPGHSGNPGVLFNHYRQESTLNLPRQTS